MNIRTIATWGCVLIGAALMTGCRVSYSLSGASIPVNARTVSIEYFPNNAPMVAPTLSSAITDGLQDRFSRQTKLDLVREAGDLRFAGEITNYTSTPAAITGDEMAATNRLTVTVRVTFESVLQPEFNFTNRTFTAFQEYPSTEDLMTVESTLIPQLVEVLVDDIFNAAVANW